MFPQPVLYQLCSETKTIFQATGLISSLLSVSQTSIIVSPIIAFSCTNVSRLMGKPTICIGENKDADQLRGNRTATKLISAFVFATWIVQFLFFLNPKFQASSSFLCLYRPVCATLLVFPRGGSMSQHVN